MKVSFAGAALACAVAAAAAAGPAAANVTIFQGNLPGNPDENLLLNSGETGLLITGETSNTGTIVDIAGDETLLSPASGQARVSAADGGLTAFDLTLADPHLGFTSFEFNLARPKLAGTTVSFTVYDQFGHTFGGASPYVLDRPFKNLFNLTATDGQLITRVRFVTSADLHDVRQIRLGGVTSFTAVPEPAAWAMMIAGFGGLGALVRRRRARMTFAAA